MVTKLNFLSNSLKIFFSETSGLILKWFHRNVPWVTLFKFFSQKFDPSINMALVNGGFLHCMDMKKFLKNLLLRNYWFDFETISQECSLGDHFQKLFSKFWSIHKQGCGEWGLLALYGHEEILKKSSSPKPLVRFWNNFTGTFLGWPFSKMFAKFWSVYKYGSGEWGLFALYRREEIHVCIVQKNLVRRNHWSDFEVISQESGFDISRRPDCPICELPWPFVSLPSK